ncbi:MAG: phosphotransferase family protein [Rhodospirillales bacterium]|nr:phosphotransferase family protein [Rhodospirillales bacterium]MBO6788248.1 phosphotransferase family protein [Rhodospirillales bacterium]
MDRDAIKRLEVWLARQSGGRAQVRDLKQLSGGAIQENWALSLDLEGGDWPGSHDLVLRKDAPSNVAVSHGRAEEFAILKHAHDAGATVPVPCVLCEDNDVLGTPFFIMHRAEGTAAGHKLVKMDANDALAEDLGRNLARIHTIKDTPDLAFVAKPDGPAAMSSVNEYRRHLDDLPGSHPALEWGLAWLEANAPSGDEIVFSHRDYRTGNYMVTDGKLTAILDWEFAGWSDPMEDIGWLTAKCWRFGANDRVCGGVGSLDALIRGYEAESGRTVDRPMVAYWQVMATMRWAVIALQQADRFVTGGERNLELALTAHIVPELEMQILDATAPVDPAPLPDGVQPVRPDPSLDALLGIARDIVRNDLASVLDGDARYKALMAANALGIVERQITGLSVGADDEGRKEMAARIRDGDGTVKDHAQLLAEVRATLKESNPRALG